MKVNNKNLKEIEAKGVIVPSYDRKELRASCVHIGFGHFHRSHFLTYMDTLLSQGKEKSGVFEIDIMPASQSFISALKEQDFLYSVLSLGADGSEELRINGSIVGYANETIEPEIVMDRLSSFETKLITLTITEKGYCYLDDKGTLDWDNPDIIHDLECGDAPKTAIGCLARALMLRCKNNQPVTIMSCDNVPENGLMLKACILQFCEKRYPDIVSWVKERIAFPCTMVDRITPGTTDLDISYLKEKYDLEDMCPVHCEDFLQWVVEDQKCTEIPDFSVSGAMIVEDVRPYELMKIRLLNGSHSALSYPAYMMGIKMVHDAALNPVIGHFIRNSYMEAITKTLAPVPGMDLDSYKDKLISRFSNANIADTILRLASDGSKKISNAILRPLEEGLAKGINVDALILALALWQYYYLFKDVNGDSMPIDDPKKEELLAVASDSRAFLRIAGLSEIASSSEYLFHKMEEYLCCLKDNGVEATLKSFSN